MKPINYFLYLIIIFIFLKKKVFRNNFEVIIVELMYIKCTRNMINNDKNGLKRQ